MLRPSRRDQLALETLLPLIDREITADPEQRNPARRAARRHEVSRATLSFKNLRVEQEERKDRELRAKLNGVTMSPLISSHSVKQPTARLAVRAEVNTRPLHSDHAEERYGVPMLRSPLRTIANPASVDTTRARPPTKRTSPSTAIYPTTDSRPNTTATTHNNILAPPDCRLSDVQRPELPTSALTTPLVVTPGLGNVATSKSSSVDMFGSSARTSSGRAGPGEGPEKVVKSGNSYSQRSQEASQDSTPHGGTATISRSTKADAAHVQGRLEPQPEASSLAAESYVRTCSVALHRGRTPVCGLLHRKDFDVERICKKLLADRKVIYEVRWKSSWVPAKLIVKGNDVEYSHVDADGTRWYIKETFNCRERNGIEEVEVRWMDTKEPAEMLINAQEAIDTFEADRKLAGVDEIAQVRQRRVLTIPESQFPHNSVLPQSEEDYNEAQRWVSSTWPEIRPHKRLDLYPAIYQIHMEIASSRRQKKRGGKSYRWLMKLPQLRPLRWSYDFLQSETSLNCRSRKRASLFIQVTAAQVDRQCTRCSHHKNAPFLECVRTAPDQRLWLNGACANCGIQRNVGCDYHGTLVGRIGAASDAARSTNHSNSAITAHQQGRSANTTLGGDDDDSSDTSEDGSDDDDYTDDEDDDDDANDNFFGEGQEAETGVVTSGSRLLPPFPPSLPVTDSVIHGALATSSFAENWTPSSAKDFGGLGLTSSMQNESRGKLPSATKSRERLSQKSRGQASSLSALFQHVRTRNDSNGNSSGLNIDADENVQTQPEQSASQQSTGDNYTPQPIESDLLELAFKYDHLGPLKHPTQKNAVSASTSTTINREPGHADTAVDQMAQHMSVQNKHTPHFSPDPPSPVSKKRPASIPPLHRRRPAQRQAFTRPDNPASPTSVLPSTAPTARPSLIVPTNTNPTHISSPRTFIQIRTLDKLERNDVHTGCREGQPCRDHKYEAPIPRDPDAKVYRNMLRDGRKISLEEAEYIVSRANCFWARRFTVLWENWCEDLGGIDNEERSQIEWLLSYPEALRRAAEECCPRRPRVRQFAKDPNDIVPIDD